MSDVKMKPVPWLKIAFAAWLAWAVMMLIIIFKVNG